MSEWVYEVIHYLRSSFLSPFRPYSLTHVLRHVLPYGLTLFRSSFDSFALRYVLPYVLTLLRSPFDTFVLAYVLTYVLTLLRSSFDTFALANVLTLLRSSFLHFVTNKITNPTIGTMLLTVFVVFRHPLSCFALRPLFHLAACRYFCPRRVRLSHYGFAIGSIADRRQKQWKIP